MAQVAKIPNATVCIAATNVPKRPVKISTVIYSVNISTGIVKRFNKKVVANVPSAKRTAIPATKKVGYWVADKGEPTYQAAKGIKAKDSNFPIVGKLKEAGIITSKGDSSYSISR